MTILRKSVIFNAYSGGSEEMDARMERGSVPVTSESLLLGLAESREASWRRFVALYRPMMRAFLGQRKYAKVDAEETIQETLVELFRVMPHYRYRHGEKGAFHCYLKKIMRNLAVSGFRRQSRRGAREMAYLERRIAAGDVSLARDWESDEEAVVPARVLLATGDSESEREELEWHRALLRLALQELEGSTGNKLHWQIFARTALDEEPAGQVAESLMVSCDMVYQTKKRMLGRLKSIVKGLVAVGAA